MNRKHYLCSLFTAAALFLASGAQADLPWQFADNTRYMAMGDSLAAGYGAIPATQGYAYRLYQDGTFDTITNTILANASVPGATSGDVLAYQVPMALDRFQPTVVTLTVGGNDLLSILNGADPNVVLPTFQNNLVQILSALHFGLPDARIYISNQYTVPEIVQAVPGADQIVDAFNQVIEGVAAPIGVGVADVHSAFLGRNGLLLIERNGAGQFEVHPTNAGHRVMADAFRDADGGS